jgi:hypothetical protein
MGARSLCVDDSLGNTLLVMTSGKLSIMLGRWRTNPIKVGKKIDQVEVLEQQRTALARSLGLIRVREGSSIGGGVQNVLGRRALVVVVLTVRHDEARLWAV